MTDNHNTSGFWEGEVCEYCGGPIVDKQVTLHRQVKGPISCLSMFPQVYAKNVVHATMRPIY